MHYVGSPSWRPPFRTPAASGIITALTQGTPEKLANEIARCRDDDRQAVRREPDLSAAAHAAGLSRLHQGHHRQAASRWSRPPATIRRNGCRLLKDAGIKVIHKCTSVRHSLKAQAIGCDAVSVDGFECGGHPGEDDIPNFILLPRAADELKIPFVASGGMADGRSLVAALALGAAGMNMGTRFIATKEAPVHDNVKQAHRRRQRAGHPPRHAAAAQHRTRAEVNAGVERLLEKERALGSKIKFEDIVAEVGGVYPRIMQDGEMDAGAWSCGMVAGLIHDIPTVEELIQRTMRDAESIIARRLAGFMKA
jgi:NAD(P)H-dependent flavin oxidoreductase YrpB (nitropropane dioxygenase family)